jgi:plasmid stability protein
MPAPIVDVSKHNKAHLGIRLRDDEKRRLEARAKAAGKSVGEWAREVLVSTTRFSPDYRGLLAEFCAMRKVVLDIHAQLALNGQAPSAEAIKGIVEAAEVSKFTMADRRILNYLE